MIRREEKGKYFLIRQDDHAKLSGELAKRKDLPTGQLLAGTREAPRAPRQRTGELGVRKGLPEIRDPPCCRTAQNGPI